MAEGFDRLRMRERGLDHQPDAAARQREVDADQHAYRHRHHEYAVDRIIGRKQRKCRAVEGRRHRIRNRRATPDQMRCFFDEICKPECKQKFGYVAVLVRRTQAVAFDRHAHRPYKQGGERERWPEADPAADLVGEIRADHVEAGVREIKYPHHAENDGKPRGKHEQQQPVGNAVQHRNQEEFHGAGFGDLSSGKMSRTNNGRADAPGRLVQLYRKIQAFQGRFIWQEVGWVVT